jgi:glyoxylase-like metal-dependent hydrolase (beta-lactamase superfamily II)
MRPLFRSLVLASSFFVLPAACSPGAADSGTIVDDTRPLTIQRFTSDGSGFDTHSFFVDTGKEVVVFDAQFTPDLAQRAIREIKSKTASPIKYVVVTHPNPDKFNGLRAFQDLGAQAVASATTASAIPAVHAYKKYYFVNIAKMFTEQTYPQEARIDRTFQGEYVLPLESGHSIRLRELTHSGVTTTQTVAYVPAAQALFVGDLVHHRAHAWLEGGIVSGKATPSLSAWAAALSELQQYPEATVYGGRGEPAPVATAVAAQTQYLSDLEALVRAYVASLGANAKSELGGSSAGLHYKKIAEQATQKYPQYALPYLVEYGVYGLVNQIAGL